MVFEPDLMQVKIIKTNCKAEFVREAGVPDPPSVLFCSHTHQGQESGTLQSILECPGFPTPVLNWG